MEINSNQKGNLKNIGAAVAGGVMAAVVDRKLLAPNDLKSAKEALKLTKDEFIQSQTAYAKNIVQNPKLQEKIKPSAEALGEYYESLKEIPKKLNKRFVAAALVGTAAIFVGKKIIDKVVSQKAEKEAKTENK